MSSFFTFANQNPLLVSRRSFITTSGLLLSGTAVALLAGQEALAKDTKSGSV